MASTHIGDFEVHRVAEFEGPFFPPSEFFPDFDPEIVRAHADLLGPQLIEPGSGNMTSLTGNTITANSTGIEVLNGCITATGNVIGGSLAGLRNQCSTARPPMPKRSQASRNTGMAAASGLDSAT